MQNKALVLCALTELLTRTSLCLEAILESRQIRFSILKSNFTNQTTASKISVYIFSFNKLEIKVLFKVIDKIRRIELFDCCESYLDWQAVKFALFFLQGILQVARDNPREQIFVTACDWCIRTDQSGWSFPCIFLSQRFCENYLKFACRSLWL